MALELSAFHQLALWCTLYLFFLGNPKKLTQTNIWEMCAHFQKYSKTKEINTHAYAEVYASKQ